MFGSIAFVVIAVLSVLVGSLVPGRARAVLWGLVIIGGVVPWSAWVGHPHVERIEWMPFANIVRARDIVLNVALYVPLGFFVADTRTSPAGRRSLVVAGAVALMLSMLTEATQVFSHRRYPAAGDVVTNTTGALIGGWMALAVRRRRAPVDARHA